MVRPLEDDEVDRPEVEVRQRMQLTGTNRSRSWPLWLPVVSGYKGCKDIPGGFEGANILCGPVAQLVRAPPCHGGGREFESHLGRF